MKPLPKIFIDNIQSDLGDDTPKLIAALAENSPISIRNNPKKTNPNPQSSSLKEVAWHKENGQYLPERPIFTLDPAFHAGAYYVQEASSMFIAEALSQVVDLQKDISVLDLCAAPGGKTTLLASVLTDNSFLLANEVIKSRVEVLKENVMKWGYPNVFISNHDTEDFASNSSSGVQGGSSLVNFFDVILIDAPCSGEGLFRKDERAIDEWSYDNVQICAARQKRILTNAVSLLKPDGILLYSTCTYNHFENMDNVEWLTQNFDIQSIRLDIRAFDGIVEKEKAGAFGYQFYPHRIKGEGFFLAVLKKTKEEKTINSALKNVSLPFQKLPRKQIDIASKWLQNADDFEFFLKPNGQVFIILKKHITHIALVDKALKRKSTGLEIGEFKGQDFIPSHELALSNIVAADTPSVFLPKNDALKYLKKENIEIDTPLQGWALAKYEGLNLGWMKVLKNRVNNYLPKDFRIRMDLPREN
jgi:16S rRNA C967 or C1407 C5-methylase (RsmB/RsmF family)/NOL1/NOP2/fmu family ribosome biogenesis protein